MVVKFYEADVTYLSSARYNNSPVFFG